MGTLELSYVLNIILVIFELSIGGKKNEKNWIE
jgi:hypothetical protein